MEQPDTRPTDHDGRCMVCGRATIVALCSVACRAEARTEAERNATRIERLRALGFDARLDEVQAVVRRTAQLTAALGDPVLVSVGATVR